MKTFSSSDENVATDGLLVTGLGFKIPSTQTPTINSVDEAAHILYSEIDSSFDSDNLPETIDLKFSHIAAYGKFMLRNFPENVTIKKIDFL